MIERFTRKNEIAYVKMGLISAITAVNLKIEEKSPNEYESSGRRILNHLADKESLINSIAPRVFERNREIIEETRESFPEPKILDSLLTLFNEYCKL